MRAILEAISLYLQRVRTYNPMVVIVELLLIGAVVWWVMRFLRGTRGARLVKGFALLLACVYVVILMLPERLGWQRIQLLYGHFLLFAFAAVVVAFQPELRQAFIQIGQARFFRSAPRADRARRQHAGRQRRPPLAQPDRRHHRRRADGGPGQLHPGRDASWTPTSPRRC